MDSKAKAFGIIGAGYIANLVHLPILSGLNEAKVLAICDEDESKARRTAKRFKIPRMYTDVVEMFEKEDLDIIDILTPPDTHVNLAIQALKKGYHCLIEKPLATKVAEADEVIRVAKEEESCFTCHPQFFFYALCKKSQTCCLNRCSWRYGEH